MQACLWIGYLNLTEILADGNEILRTGCRERGMSDKGASQTHWPKAQWPVSEEYYLRSANSACSAMSVLSSRVRSWRQSSAPSLVLTCSISTLS